MLVKLMEELTVARAFEVRALLLAALGADGEVELDTGEVTEVDMAGLQVLCAAHRSAREARKTLRFADGSPGKCIVKGMEAAGLGRLDACVGPGPEKEGNHG